ncbi:hemolysin family protein [Haliangium ochraceum]|uniref:CBS domain containing protein n=1 Tax=Haliangium ochraceum (strain DSM 14365 / JCM 11303 / SMP-2) TaxID=502025 RepID=D0LGS4_HALO1|nr:hemolysin family protein [Haliangium ochraceum]ACY14646.1 protein of unknown function DUF21 [Haliangium ochraceum DSM 14365]
MLLFSSFVIIVLLIALNAFYVAAEFAAVGVRRSRIQQLAADGGRLAKRLLPVVSDAAALDRYIAACQVGITVSSLLLGAFGQATLAPPLGHMLESVAGVSETAGYSIATGVILLCLTAAQMVLGELFPKALALRFPAEVAQYTVIPMRGSLRLFSVLIALLNGSGLLLLKLLGVKHESSRHVHSPQEIDFLLRESSQGGVIAPEEMRRLHNALHLSGRTAGQLMVPREQIVAISVRASSDEILTLATESPFTRLPVYRDHLDEIVGLLHTKDVLLTKLERGFLPPLRRLMRPAVTAPADTPADRLLFMFQEQHSQQALVTGEDGRVVGLVTLEDALADLFGELADEFKIRRKRRGDTPAAMTRLERAAKREENKPS